MARDEKRSFGWRTDKAMHWMVGGRLSALGALTFFLTVIAGELGLAWAFERMMPGFGGTLVIIAFAVGVGWGVAIWCVEVSRRWRKKK